MELPSQVHSSFSFRRMQLHSSTATCHNFLNENELMRPPLLLVINNKSPLNKTNRCTNRSHSHSRKSIEYSASVQTTHKSHFYASSLFVDGCFRGDHLGINELLCEVTPHSSHSFAPDSRFGCEF